MSGEEEKKEKQPVPTYAPTEEEMAQTETGVPTAPAEYPLFKKMDAIKASIDALTAEVKNAVSALRNLSATIPSSVLASANKVATKTTPKPAETPAPVAQPTQEQKPSKLEEVKMAFPEDLETLLYFEEKDGYVILKPRQFLGSENFAKIASTVRGLNGEYMSAGKESHFRVKA